MKPKKSGNWKTKSVAAAAGFLIATGTLFGSTYLSHPV